MSGEEETLCHILFFICRFQKIASEMARWEREETQPGQ